MDYVFEVSADSDARVKYKNGRAVMTVSDGRIASALVFPEGVRVRISKPL